MKQLASFVLCLVLCGVLVATAPSPGSGASHVAILSEEEWSTLRDIAKEAPCEGVLNGTYGKLTSPNYPQDYPDNMACAWDVMVPEQNTISLRFTDFHIQPSQNCIADYVGVYDGENYFLFCGWQPPQEIRSKGNLMAIVLVSDNEVHIGSRFSAEFEAVPEEELCGDTVTATVTSDYDYGFMYSPGYPSGYPPNADESCDRVMFTAAGELRVGFLQMRTKAEDRVTVSSRDSASILLSGNLDFNYKLPELLSDSSNIRMSLHSDGSGTDAGYLVAYAGALDGESTGQPWWTSDYEERTQGWWDYASTEYPPHACALRRVHNEEEQQELTPSGQKKGKKEHPVAVIQKTADKKSTKKKSHDPHTEPVDVIHVSLSDDTLSANSARLLVEATHYVDKIPGRKFGFIKSPNHPDLYPDNSNIMFNVTTSGDSRIALRFLRFDIEREADTVKVSEPGYPNIYVDCLFRDVIYSKGSEIYITFSSDYSVRRSGFLVAFASIET